MSKASKGVLLHLDRMTLEGKEADERSVVVVTPASHVLYEQVLLPATKPCRVRRPVGAELQLGAKLPTDI
ncbi:hypothetical protein DPMN_011301 [Dreissena polymorpha]|uniref:Uncharacterized protein n=1 Tax=Dreissena polymorpha TaxID=45954 RepID=A0A9D4N1H2_DREPO|nr:hypothetical protein DPMN_011301 [Dreissena polymorpha]